LIEIIGKARNCPKVFHELYFYNPFQLKVASGIIRWVFFWHFAPFEQHLFSDLLSRHLPGLRPDLKDHRLGGFLFFLHIQFQP